MDPLRDHLEKLREGVQDVSEHAASREDVLCRAGCASCCQDGLSVSTVEAFEVALAAAALPDAVKRRLGASEGCAFLVEERCAVYAARPMVCRSQGLPLAYPAGTVPVERLSARAVDGRDLSWCPLNYEVDPPERHEILDAGRVDEILAAINHEFCRRDGRSSLDRVSLRSLALKARDAT